MKVESKPWGAFGTPGVNNPMAGNPTVGAAGRKCNPPLVLCTLYLNHRPGVATTYPSRLRPSAVRVVHTTCRRPSGPKAAAGLVWAPGP